MNPNRRLAALALISSFVVASCGGGGSSTNATTPPPPAPAPPPPGGGVTEPERIAAAIATVATNPKCSVATLGTYYWEIGDADGIKASGSVGSGAPTASTTLWIFSASKWLYAANVLQKHGSSNAAEMKFLKFTSGYSKYTNAPICLPGPGSDTVQGCFPLGGVDELDPATVDRFAYDSGHMQHHATNFMGLGAANNAVLASDLSATLGISGFSYRIPQLAAGVQTTSAVYAQFLRRVLRSELAIAGALGTQKVCAQQAATGCNAAATPDSIGTEAWNYSLGHWVEDDPTIGDHAFSSAGGGGFYPWIDSSKTYYGIVARERETETSAGYHSAECGRLVRQAWRTGVTVTATSPTP